MSWASKLANPYRVTNEKKFRLKDYDPGDTKGIDDKDEAEKLLGKGVARLAELQDKLYAQDRWALLLCSRPWTPPARTASSSTSCRASIPRDARCIRSRRHRSRSSTTTSYGAPTSAFRNAAASASSIAPTTKRCW